MSDGGERAERTARRLLRWYPKEWRSRYGDEFTELLISDCSERPQCPSRTANIAWSSMVARSATTGLVGRPFEPSTQIQLCMVSLGCALAAFLAFGIAIWSQLTVGWQWSRPDTGATTVAMVVMSGAVFLFMVVALLAALPIAWSVVVRFGRRQARGLFKPSLLFLTGTVILVIGGRHFANGWPGTGGHPWEGQGLVPGGVAAFTWASTLSVSSYWVHPGALASFPVAEIAWMAISPMVMACVVVGATKTVRRLDLSSPVLRYQAKLGAIATFNMAAFLTGACYWMIDGGPGPRNLFHIGAIDVGEVIVMAAAVTIAGRAVHEAQAGLSHSSAR